MCLNDSYLSSLKLTNMKKTVLKWMLIISALLFADWVIMIFLGCFSGMCHASDNFYCKFYCKAGIVLLLFTLFLSFYFMYKGGFQRKPKN